MILRDLKKIKLTNTHKGILGGLGLLVLIVGFAYFFYPVVEGLGKIPPPLVLTEAWQPQSNDELRKAVNEYTFSPKMKKIAIQKYGVPANWDTSKITDMSKLFNEKYSFNEYIAPWNTSNVTNMSGMFWQANQFNQYIGNWDTSKVTDMSAMFSHGNFNQDIGNWNTSKVVDMGFMFSNATKFNQDISRWDTRNVTTMLYMFSNASAFNQNIFSWNLSSLGVGSHRNESIFEGASSMKARYNVPDSPNRAWFAAKAKALNEQCDTNFTSFTDKYKDFKIKGAWAPGSGFVVYPYKFNDIVVFIGRDSGYYKMIGYNFCNSPEGERITGRAVWDGGFGAMNPKKMTSDKVREIWEKAGKTEHINIPADKYGLTKSLSSVGPVGPVGPVVFKCREQFNLYKPDPIIYGSWLPGGAKTRDVTNITDAGSGKVIVVFTTYDHPYWKMVGYDFCTSKPERIDGRAKKATRSDIDKYRSGELGSIMPNMWNNADYKNINSTKYNLKLERKQ